MHEAFHWTRLRKCTGRKLLWFWLLRKTGESMCCVCARAVTSHSMTSTWQRWKDERWGGERRDLRVRLILFKTREEKYRKRKNHLGLFLIKFVCSSLSDNITRTVQSSIFIKGCQFDSWYWNKDDTPTHVNTIQNNTNNGKCSNKIKRVKRTKIQSNKLFDKC